MAHYQLIKDNVKVTLDDETNEGYFGDYNPEDPDDALLLRFSVDFMPAGESEWQEVDDSSYCTRVPSSEVNSDRANALLNCIMDEVYSPLQGGYSIKKTCEKLSWIK